MLSSASPLAPAAAPAVGPHDPGARHDDMVARGVRDRDSAIERGERSGTAIPAGRGGEWPGHMGERVPPHSAFARADNIH